VQAESLEVLEKADVPPAQARAIVRAIEIEIAGAKDTLATKHDILLQRQDSHEEVGKLRQQTTELGASLRGEMTELRASLRGEMSELRGELRAEIHRSVSGVTRQMYTALLGQMAVLLGFAYFFATNIA
jgi:predicted  nucleic acid-binding Zn-ribbon protein